MNKQIDQLKQMQKNFGKQINVLTAVNKKASSKLDFKDQKKTLEAGEELKKAINLATEGNTEGITKFIDKYANINK